MKCRVSSPEMHMQNRTAKFVSAIFASLLAGAALATISHGEARAADDCLSEPKDQTPQGSHWYYRIDHATKRHCWYLRAESEKPSQTAATNSPPAAKRTAPSAEAASMRSIADAHAELPAPTAFEQPNRNDAPAPVLPANAAGMDNNQPSNAADANAPSVVASRWPDTSGATSTLTPQPTSVNLAANVPSNPTAEPPPAAADATLAAADYSQVAAPSGSIQMLLVAITGALALAGIIGSVIFRFSAWRRPRPAKVHARRSTIWEPTDDDGTLLSAYPGADILPRRPARDLDRSDDADGRAAEFFSHLSRRTPT
jgi:hypothetical protein